jgi:hypothetical protein
MTRTINDILNDVFPAPRNSEAAPTGEVQQPTRGISDILNDIYGNQPRTSAGQPGGSAVMDFVYGAAGRGLEGTALSLGGIERMLRMAGGDPSIRGREGPRLNPATWAAPATTSDPDLLVQPVMDWLNRTAGVVLDQRSARGLLALENSRVTGNPFQGEAIDWGEDPSLRGYTQQFFEGLGSMAPVIIATLATRSPVGGAVAGGGQGAEASRDEAIDRVDRLVQGLTPEQLAELPTYAQAIREGRTPEQALEAVRAQAGDAAFLYTLPVSMAGDYVTGRIIRNIGGNGVIRNTITGGIEEGIQEVAEGLTSEAGTASTGLEVEYGEDSAANFVMGALVGGGVGAGSALATRGSQGPGTEISDQDLGPDLVDPTGDAPDIGPNNPPTETPITPIGQPPTDGGTGAGVNDGVNSSTTLGIDGEPEGQWDLDDDLQAAADLLQPQPSATPWTDFGYSYSQFLNALETKYGLNWSHSDYTEFVNQLQSGASQINTGQPTTPVTQATPLDSSIDQDFEPLDNAPPLGKPLDPAPFQVAGMTYVGEKSSGKTKGGIFADQFGQKHMVKSYSNSFHAVAEQAAFQLFNQAHFFDNAPTAKTVTNLTEGNTAVATTYLDNVKPFDINDSTHVALAEKHYVMNAWIGNTDVLGADGGNLVYNPFWDTVAPVDLGDSLGWSGVGKNTGFDTDVVGALSKLSSDSATAKLYSGITASKVKNQIENLASVFAGQVGVIEQLVPVTMSNKGMVVQKLKERLVDLITKYGKFAPEVEALYLNNLMTSPTPKKIPPKKPTASDPNELGKSIKIIEDQASVYETFNEDIFDTYENTGSIVETILSEPHLLTLMKNPKYDAWKVGNKLWWHAGKKKLHLFDNKDNLTMEELYLKYDLLPPIMFHGVKDGINVTWDEETQSWQGFDQWNKKKQGGGATGKDTHLGAFLTDSPEIAYKGYAASYYNPQTGNYASNLKGAELHTIVKWNVMPFVVNVNPYMHNFQSSQWKGDMHNALADVAKPLGYNAILSVNIMDQGGLQNQLIVFDPGQDGTKIKSPYAVEFDKGTSILKKSVTLPGQETRPSHGLTVEETKSLQKEFDAVYGKGVVRVSTFSSREFPGYNAFYGRGPTGLMIGLKNTLTLEEARAQLHHEAIHFLKHMGHFDSGEGKKHWMVLKRHVQGRISEGVKANYAPDVWIEEEIARYVESVARGEVTPSSTLQAAVKWVRDFFTALMNWGRGLGFTTPEQVARKIMSGSRAETTWLEATGGPDTDAFTVSIDNVFAASKSLGVNPSKKFKQATDWYGRITKFAHTVKQLAEKNTHIPWLQEYVQRVGQWHIKKMTWLSHADNTIGMWNNLSFAEQENLSRAFFDIEEQVEYKDTTIVENGKLSPLEAKLLKDNNVSKNALKVYLQVRQDFRNMLNEVERVAIENVKTMLANDILGQQIETAKIRKEFNQLKKHAYFPHTRFGDFTIVVKDSQGKTVYAEMFEKEKSRDKAVAAVRAKFPQGKGFTVATSKLSEEAKVYRGIPQSLLVHMKNQLNLDKKQMAALEEMIVHSMPAVSFKNHFTKKERVEGFSRDALRAYAEYMWHGSNHIARIEFGPLMEEAIQKGEADIKQRINTGQDSTKRRKITDYLLHHYESIMNPKEDWAGLRSLGFIWWLGYNVKSAVLNFTQVPLVTYSHLGAHFGTLKASAEMTKTMAHIRTIYRSPKKAATKHTQFLGKMIGLGIEQGFIDESFAANLAGIAEGSNLNQSIAKTKVRKMMLQFNQGAGFMFQAVEKLNRIVSFVSATELARKNPNAKYLEDVKKQNDILINDLVHKNGLTYDEAVAFAAGKHTVDSTQFNYSAWARPRLMEGRKSAFLTFFMFTQNMLWFIGNNPGRTRYLLLLLLFAGITGLPGYEDLQAMVKLVGSRIHKDWNMERELREIIVEAVGEDGPPPDLFLNGISRYGFGLSTLGQMTGLPVPDIDMSASVGMGSPLPVISPAIQAVSRLGTGGDFDEVMGEFTQEGVGPTFAIPIGIMRAVADSSMEPTDLRRWEQAMPATLASISRAVRYGTEGRERTRTGAQLVGFDRNDPEHLAEIVARSLGFTPTRVSQAWDHTIMQREAAAFWQGRRLALFNQYNWARESGDREALRDFYDAMRRYNQQVPRELAGLRVTQENLNRSYDARERARTRFENNQPVANSMGPVYREIDRLHPEVDERVPSGR